MASLQRKEMEKYSPGIFSRKATSCVSPTPLRNSTGSLGTTEEYPVNELESRNSKRRKHNRWHLLKRRLTRKGVVPVNREHPRYDLLSCIREGLRQVAFNNPDIAPKTLLGPEDFSDVIRKKIKLYGKEYEFESYASSVFATVRQAFGILEEQYANAVAPVNLPYLEFISNSKSGQDFFLSNDMQFMFKSNRRRDVIFFLSMLRDYLQHFITYPHSLLVKYIGCYAIKFKGRPKKYFLAMQSIFYPADRIEHRFDIKGCTAGRYQRPRDPDSHIITVLKDQNFLEENLQFDDQGQWFIEQIKADSKFLSDLNCMDYSLLIGRQRKQTDEKQTEPVSALIDRIGKSISPTGKGKGKELTPSIASSTDTSILDRSHHNTNGSTVISSATSSKARSMSIVTAHNLPEAEDGTLSSTVVLPPVTPGLMFPRSLAEGVDKFQEEHRRLLPKCRNSLHIIDGKDFRYFLGIVDFLTRFDWRQKSAQYWKMIKYGCGDHSTKNPEVYSRRFVDFLSERVT